MFPADALETIGDDVAYLTQERTNLQELCDALASDVTFDAAAANCGAVIDVDAYFPHPVSEIVETHGELRIGLAIPLDGDQSKESRLLFVAQTLSRYAANIIAAVGQASR